ncbi:unnamed protein product, partial [Soboliphyme baturini]|uniref:TMF_TATA_bd domain-containing protein n=1 Tax=Soboliphyme baturini TaxID=241478 RepID=A0A183ITE2_9BILA
IIVELESKISTQCSTIAQLKVELSECENERDEIKERSETFAKQIAELSRQNMAKEEKITMLEAASREARHADLRQKLETLQSEYDSQKRILEKQKLQAAEWRNQELTDGVVEATRPLMKEIESLKAFYRNRQVNWEQSERLLHDRIRDTERKLAAAKQNETATLESYKTCCARQKELENSLSKVVREKEQVEELLTSVRHDLQLAVESEKMTSSSLEAERKQHAQMLAEMKRREQEISVTALDTDDLKERQRLELVVKEMKEKLAYQAELWESVDNIANVSFLSEHLRERLQAKEGEFKAMREEYRKVLATRDALAAEITKLNNELQENRSAVAELSELKDSFQDLNNRHQALLQLYGQKIEEADELRMDLQDLKDMYRQQVK